MRRAFALTFCIAASLLAAPCLAAENDSGAAIVSPHIASPAVTSLAVAPNHQAVPLQTASPQNKAADPFLAGAMGMIPFVSGFYVSDAPAKGLVFTLVDGLLVLGIYTARYTEQGNPDNVPRYFLLMGVNNLLDAILSARDATKKHRPHSRVTLRPEGGVQYALQWTF
jgi:hypothetical protein